MKYEYNPESEVPREPILELIGEYELVFLHEFFLFKINQESTEPMAIQVFNSEKE
jgi:hypothetical protein